MDDSPDRAASSAGRFPPDVLRLVFDASPSAMILVGADGLMHLVNRQACRLFGYERDGMVGQPVERLVPERLRDGHATQRLAFFAAPAERAMGEGRDLFGLRRDGSEVPIEIGLNPLRTAAGLFVLAAIVDISARKRSEELLRQSLHEKETLLREIHHRVKNNMQVVSSLISLQAGSVDEPRLRALFTDCQTRVRTMALIHEKLYSTGNLAALDGGEYLRDLLRMLLGSTLPDRRDVVLELDVESVVLDSQTAIPVGLIVHELVANALRHAFRERRGGRLRVALRAGGDGRCRLEVADDGPGLPAGFRPEQARGIGLRMVRSLVRQLDGSLQQPAGPGTTFTVEFPQPSSTPAP